MNSIAKSNPAYANSLLRGAELLKKPGTLVFGMAQLKIGDVVEISSSKGLVYAHYTNKHDRYGALLRIFRRFYEHRPSDLADVVRGKPTFMCFFPLGAAVSRKTVSIAGNVPIPLEAQELPIFRGGVVDPTTGKVAVWWLWDGEEEWRVGELTAEQRHLPIRGVWNHTLLVKRIESGWTPETDQW